MIDLVVRRPVRGVEYLQRVSAELYDRRRLSIFFPLPWRSFFFFSPSVGLGVLRYHPYDTEYRPLRKNGSIA